MAGTRAGAGGVLMTIYDDGPDDGTDDGTDQEPGGGREVLIFLGFCVLFLVIVGLCSISYGVLR